MAMKVYGHALSPNVARVLITLYEKHVNDFELIHVDMSKGEHKSPDYLKIHPFGSVPAFKDGDLTLFESRAICRLLCHKFEGQGTELYGTTPKDKALVEQWLEVEGQNFNGSIGPLAFQLVFAPLFGRSTDQAVVTTHLAKVEKILDVYEKQLSKSKYLAGDFFSLADLSHIPYLHYVIKAGKKGDELLESRSGVKTWWEAISSRPSSKKWVALLDPKQQG